MMRMQRIVVIIVAAFALLLAVSCGGAAPASTTPAPPQTADAERSATTAATSTVAVQPTDAPAVASNSNAPVQSGNPWDYVPRFIDQEAGTEGLRMYQYGYRPEINRADCHRLGQLLAYLGRQYGTAREGAKQLAIYIRDENGGSVAAYAFEIAEDWKACANRYYH